MQEETDKEKVRDKNADEEKEEVEDVENEEEEEEEEDVEEEKEEQPELGAVGGAQEETVDGPVREDGTVFTCDPCTNNNAEAIRVVDYDLID